MPPRAHDGPAPTCWFCRNSRQPEHPPRDLLNHRRFVDRQPGAARSHRRVVRSRISGSWSAARSPTRRPRGSCCSTRPSSAHDGRVVGAAPEDAAADLRRLRRGPLLRAGARATPIVFKGVRLGVTVCEEVWNDAGLLAARGCTAAIRSCDLAASWRRPVRQHLVQPVHASARPRSAGEMIRQRGDQAPPLPSCT